MTESKNDITLNQILRILPLRIRKAVSSAVTGCFSQIHEIVLRSSRPVCIYKNGVQYFLTENGCLTSLSDSQPLVIISANEMTECFNFACGHSVYSHINEIKEGFVTINGGHRVGISGTAVVSNEEVTNIRDFSTISIRISREIIGCGNELAKHLFESKEGLLICGAPCSGKSTVLRDIARILSSDYLCRVCVIDSKSELAAVYKGILQKDLGMCDVMDSYPRDVGIMQAIRLFSPEYIICDEIGSESDVNALLSGVNSGVYFVATMHAGSLSELKSRRYFTSIVSTGAFKKIAFLSGRESPGKVKSYIESCDFYA
ncbi:MAG: stage III sporulation protein AA [Ruminococcaceae bacterium]|nr:stage III sporulation protein AA [Oscillospiraceae bacterium]